MGRRCAETIMVYVEPSNDTVVVVGDLLSEQACARFERALGALRESAPDIATVDVSRVSVIAARSVDLLFALWRDLFRQSRPLHLLAPDHVWNMLGEAAVNQVLGRRTAVAPAETGHPEEDERGGALWRLSK